MTDATYLVFLGTSKQGRATIDALRSKGVPQGKIVTTSRNPTGNSSTKLIEDKKVKTVLKADYTDSDSVLAAIKESNATRIWFTTDYWSIPKPSREKEFQLGKTVVDAILKCKDQNIEYVVYSSVGDADNCPKTIEHFWSKADIEEYMKKELGNIKWSFIRPAAFLDNLDAPDMYNPLKKGVVKFFTKPQYATKFIATVDIGKGSAEMLMKPNEYSGKTIDAATCEYTGPQLAEALTEASGTECKYQVSMPRWLMWLLVRDAYHMTNWFESDGYTADVDAYKKIVPDAMDAKAWFASKGQWSNGEKFASAK